MLCALASEGTSGETMAGGTPASAMRARLLSLYEAAVAAAHPDACLPPHLPAPPSGGRIIVVGAGKAAAAMAAAAENHYRQLGVLDRVTGFTTAPHGTRDPRGDGAHTIGLAHARHPTPDADSVAAAERTLALAAGATADDLVLVLFSGGASSLWAAPVHGIELAAKTALTRGLLKCGADIHEMNTVRRHISRIKGGRLRKATAARMLTLAISDVPGDDPATIGSGPTVPDPTTLADARAVLARRRPLMEALGLPIPSAVEQALGDAGQRNAEAGRSGLCHRRVPPDRDARGIDCPGRRSSLATSATRSPTSATH